MITYDKLKNTIKAVYGNWVGSGTYIEDSSGSPTTLALLFVYDIQIQPICLIYSGVLLGILFFVSLIFTNLKENINYVDNSEFLGFQIPYYRILWILLAFIFLVLPTYYFQYLLYSIFIQ